MSNSGNSTIVGLVYSTQCIHCRHLFPIWEKMKKNIDKKVKKNEYKNIKLVEIEYADGSKLAQFNEQHKDQMNNQPLIINGLPTLFKVESGVIEYYKGDREPSKMEHWYMKNNKMNKKRKTQRTGKKNKLASRRKYGKTMRKI